MNTDQAILEFLAWCHRNPITFGLVLPVLWAGARKTKTTWDDWALQKLMRATGHAEIPRAEG